MAKTSIQGEYKRIPGTDLYINVYGYIQDSLGRMRYPCKKSGRIYYRVGPNTGNWAVNVSRIKLLNNIWHRELKGSDADLYNVMRNVVRYRNVKRGFERKRTVTEYEQQRQRERTDEDETSRGRAKTNRPCKDGRAKDCYGYLPRGYHSRCPNCWRDLREDSGYCELDYPGRLIYGQYN